MLTIRRLVGQILVAILIACAALAVLLWYASLERHIPPEWSRVYVGSNCAASNFSVYVATQLGTDRPLATIPIDDGDIAPAACQHTRDLLVEDSLVWRPITLLPDSLVCSRLTLAGWTFMQRRTIQQWPIFVGNGEESAGSSVEGIRAAGVAIETEEFQEFARTFAADNSIETRRADGDLE